MEQEELKKQYKKGVIAGVIVGGGIFLALGILAVAFVASYFFTKNNVGAQFVIGDDVVRKSNALIEYIDKNFSEIKSIADVAEKCYISIPTINRLFKKHLNTTPNDFLNLTKLAKAKKLLDDGFSVTDSCVQAGFSNCSYFISLFKKQYGTTPHRYKGQKG